MKQADTADRAKAARQKAFYHKQRMDAEAEYKRTGKRSAVYKKLQSKGYEPKSVSDKPAAKSSAKPAAKTAAKSAASKPAAKSKTTVNQVARKSINYDTTSDVKPIGMGSRKASSSKPAAKPKATIGGWGAGLKPDAKPAVFNPVQAMGTNKSKGGTRSSDPVTSLARSASRAISSAKKNVSSQLSQAGPAAKAYRQKLNKQYGGTSVAKDGK